MMRYAISRRLVLAAAGTLAAETAIARVADPESREQALIAAAERGVMDDVRRLLGEGAQVDGRDSRGRTALLIATIHNRVEVARALIAAGADVNAKDTQSDSPFLYAGAEGRLDILRMTLAAGADLRSTNRYGGTALIPACHRGHVEAVRELLKTGIDIDHINNLGWTALLEAIILGDGSARYVEIVRLLVGARANPNLADRDGIGPLTHARRRGFGAIAGILQAAGAR
jgi:ankyrin repeat protein